MENKTEKNSLRAKGERRKPSSFGIFQTHSKSAREATEEA